MSRALSVCSFVLLAAGCGDSTFAPADLGGDAALPVDLAADDQASANDLSSHPGPPDLAGVDLAGYPAPHDPLPLAAPHTNTTLSTVRLVTVTYDDWVYRAAVESFGDFIFDSSYYNLVAPEYGLHTGVQARRIHLPGPAPAMIQTSDLLQILDDLVSSGQAPPLTSSLSDQVAFLFYLPETTVLDDSLNGLSCDGWYGFHSWTSTGGHRVPYAIVASCKGTLDEITATASHEIIEMATDPYVAVSEGYFVDEPLPSHWHAVTDNEVADLCEDESSVYEGGFALQPIWSNAAAAAGDPPCVPNNDWPYYGMGVSPSTAPTVAKGDTVTFTLTGWAYFPRSDWSIDWQVAGGSDLDDMEMAPQLSKKKINNATTVTLTLTAPATAKSGSVGAVQVYSTTYPSRFAPVAFIVQ